MTPTLVPAVPNLRTVLPTHSHSTRRRRRVHSLAVKMELVETNRGRPCAHYLGYGYRQHRENAGGVLSWLCLKQAIKKCKGRLKSKDGEVVEVTDHQCGPPDHARLEMKRLICKAKKRAREEVTPVPKIYLEELGKVYNGECELPSDLPRESSALRILYNHRRIQKEPRSSWSCQKEQQNLIASANVEEQRNWIGHVSQEEQRNWTGHTSQEEPRTSWTSQKEHMRQWTSLEEPRNWTGHVTQAVTTSEKIVMEMDVGSFFFQENASGENITTPNRRNCLLIPKKIVVFIRLQ